MKISAYIFSSVFVVVFGLVHIHPFPLKNEVKEEQSSCAKKSKCHKQTPCQSKEENKEDCNSEGCNPFVPCAMGSCCYLVENFFSPATIYAPRKQKVPLFNDNRLLNKLSECWHPPEALS